MDIPDYRQTFYRYVNLHLTNLGEAACTGESNINLVQRHSGPMFSSQMCPDSVLTIFLDVFTCSV